jgi:hypothetical protein
LRRTAPAQLDKLKRAAFVAQRARAPRSIGRNQMRMTVLARTLTVD